MHRVDRCLRCDDDHAIRTALDAYGRMREQPAKDFCAAVRADIANVKTIVTTPAAGLCVGAAATAAGATLPAEPDPTIKNKKSAAILRTTR